MANVGSRDSHRDWTFAGHNLYVARGNAPEDRRRSAPAWRPDDAARAQGGQDAWETNIIPMDASRRHGRDRALGFDGLGETGGGSSDTPRATALAYAWGAVAALVFAAAFRIVLAL